MTTPNPAPNPTPNPNPRPDPARKRRLPRALKWTGITLAVPLVLIGAVLGALQVPAVKTMIAEQVSDMVSGPDFALKLDGLSGGMPFGPRLARVELGDGDGTWLVLEQAAVSLDPWALIGGRIHVEKVEAERLTLHRLPAGGAEETPPSDEPMDLSVPSLPKGLAVDRLAVAEIVLDPAVAGEATRLALNGRLGVDDAGAAGLTLALSPLEGEHAPRLDVEALHRPADDVLTLNLVLDEPAGGPISRIAGLPGDRPIHLAVEGEGPLTAFDARIEAAAAGAGLDGRLQLARTAEGIALALVAKADPGPFAPPEIAPLLAGEAPGLDIGLEAEMAGSRLLLRGLTLAANGLALKADGLLEDGRDASLNATIDLAPDADLPALAAVPPALRPGRVTLAAVAALDTGHVEVSRLGVEAPGAAIAGTLALAEHFDGLTGTFDVALPRLADLPAGGLTGGATARLSVDGMLADPDLGFSVAIAGKDIGGADEDPLPRLLGAAPDVTLAGRYATAGITVETLALRTAAATLDASGRFDPADGAIEAKLALVAEDLARLEAGGISGSAHVDGTVGGTIDLPVIDLTVDGKALSVGGTEVGDPSLVMKATPDPAAGTSSGRFDLALGGAWPVALGADLLFDGERAVVSAIDGTALGARIGGDVAYGLETGEITGGLKIAAARLDGFSALAGQKLAGALNIDLALAPRNGGQGADLTLDGRDIAASGVTVGRLSAKAALDDLLGAGRGRAEVTASAVASGKAVIDRLAAKADLASFDNVAFTVDLAGGVPAPLGLSGKGSFDARGAVPQLTVAKLDGQLAETPFGLRKPLTVALGPQTAVRDIALAFGKARAEGGVTLGRAMAGKLSVTGFDFADLAGLMPAADLPGGTVDLTLSLDGAAGELTLAGRGLRPPASVVDVAVADMPRPDLDATIKWRRNQADLDLAVTGIREAEIRATGTIPVRIDGGIPMPDEKGAMDVALQVNANLRRLAPLLPLGDNEIRGRLAVDARVGGSVGAPEPTGRLTLSKGRFTNGLSGFELRDMEMALAFTGESATIESLTATDGEGGTLTGTGSARQTADGDFALDAAIKAVGLRFTRLDLATTSGDIDMTVKGTATAPEVTGKVVIQRGNVEISARVPVSVPVVEVRDAGGGQAPTDLSVPGGDAKGKPPAVGHIDLTVEAPGQFFVRGRGLDSEWRGNLKLAGPITAPDARGGFEVVRGTYTLAGRPFAISEGSLTFPSGLGAPPQITVIASAPADDVEAKIAITGPVTALKIDLSSEPALPNDEVLSRVLFGRSVANLTTSQAIRLGQTALELSGKGGGDVLGGVRDALGLDRLDIGSDDSADTSGSGGALAGTSLSAGRYIADGVYLGFEQGLTPNSGSVNIEVEVYPRVTVEGSIGQADSSAVGLNYKFDY
ncbi:translocation/assembly module TamB domain-containing protein [Zavarzinia compransoris]|uniref:translocation/assembly module TamB domain-containing protein n=1 Tax=Zavarzinia marina TaxID=2911065 RepID=UPI001F44A44E|nr:translocation/assembly module TamB domain-containing protein [Zavarzinia marina]MCF4165952.1 translocation/assembly module TamB domain-containing protein [Zavarzinia marina]